MVRAELFAEVQKKGESLAAKLDLVSWQAFTINFRVVSFDCNQDKLWTCLWRWNRLSRKRSGASSPPRFQLPMKTIYPHCNVVNIDLVRQDLKYKIFLHILSLLPSRRVFERLLRLCQGQWRRQLTLPSLKVSHCLIIFIITSRSAMILLYRPGGGKLASNGAGCFQERVDRARLHHHLWLLSYQPHKVGWEL